MSKLPFVLLSKRTLSPIVATLTNSVTTTQIFYKSNNTVFTNNVLQTSATYLTITNNNLSFNQNKLAIRNTHNSDIYKQLIKPIIQRKMTTDNTMNVRYLGQEEMQKIDNELMDDEIGFSVDQLMELAGVSIATAVHRDFDTVNKNNTGKRILVAVGPGNNGGDGLVAGRHLKLFGHEVDLLYLKRPNRPLYINLLKQCKANEINLLEETPTLEELNNNYYAIIDALFGFSFTGSVREPFKQLMKMLRNTKVPIVSVDIPSGWNVEKGDINNEGVLPTTLISLTAPKLCANSFNGRHWLGGRFVPNKTAEKYNLQLPKYPGTECILLLNEGGSKL